MLMGHHKCVMGFALNQLADYTGTPRATKSASS
jgi:hypothetical protein